MNVRINFRGEIYIEGKDIEEIRDKWESINLFSKDATLKYGADFVEVMSVEDADTYEEIDF